MGQSLWNKIKIVNGTVSTEQRDYLKWIEKIIVHSGKFYYVKKVAFPQIT
jgi:hypothetical protein